MRTRRATTSDQAIDHPRSCARQGAQRGRRGLPALGDLDPVIARIERQLRAAVARLRVDAIAAVATIDRDRWRLTEECQRLDERIGAESDPRARAQLERSRSDTLARLDDLAARRGEVCHRLAEQVSRCEASAEESGFAYWQANASERLDPLGDAPMPTLDDSARAPIPDPLAP